MKGGRVKMEKKVSVVTISCFFLMALILVLGLSSISSYAGTYEYTIESGDYEIVDAGDGYQEIKMEGFGQLLNSGKPKLSSKIFAIAIPPGVRVDSIEVVGNGKIELPGTYKIIPAGMESPLDATEEEINKIKAEYDKIVTQAYASDAVYPTREGKFITQGAYRKYNLVQVRFSPFQYKAKSARLFYYSSATVTVNYSSASAISNEEGLEARPSGLMEDWLSEVEEQASEILENHNEAKGWYPALTEGEIDSAVGLYEFVIITTDALVDAVQPLVDWEKSKGRTVYVATTTWINTNYSGADLQRRIRYFLRDKYPSAEWGITNVCLVGDLTDVPMRYCHPNGSAGSSVPTDLYYAELTYVDSQSWDDDWDGYFGEYGQDTIDFLQEVNVGRIPWSDADTVEAICLKIANFGYSNYMTGYKHNVLMNFSYFWWDTDGAVLSEYLLAEDQFDDFTPYRIYERSVYHPGYTDHRWSIYGANDYMDSTWSPFVNRWTSSTRYGFVNWLGHGSSSSAAYHCGDGLSCWTFIHRDDCTSLNDSYPAIVFSDSCSTAYPDTNSLGRNVMKQGGVAFVGSSRVAYGVHGWDDPSDGNCESFHYEFARRAAYHGAYTVGSAFKFALRTMYTTWNWGTSWWQMFEWTLFGNPDMRALAEQPSLPNLDYLYRTGWSYPIVPRSASGATGTSCPVTATLPGNTHNTYYNWTWENNGLIDASTHRTTLYVDDTWFFWSQASLSAGSSQYHANIDSAKTVTGGRHTVYYYIDSLDQVWETSEGDNCWGRQFVWSPYGLSDNIPITRSAPPDSDAWGCTPGILWYNNDGFSFYVGQVHPDKWWSAVGVLPYSSGADYDVRLWDIGDYTGSQGGFGSGYLEYSSYGGSASDFVIVNDNMAPAGTYYAGVINNNDGTGDFRIEEDTCVKIFEGTNGPYLKSSTNVLDIYEYYIYPAGDYGIKLEQTSGTCDLGMSLYDDETVHCKKSEYMPGGYANSNGDGGDEFMQVTIPDSGFHGLVVWKADSSDYAKTSTYKIKMGKCATPGTSGNPVPADGATGVSVNTDLDWDDCTDTEYYEVWLREGSNAWVKLGETETSSWTLGTLNYDETYTWVVKAVNICGDWVWGCPSPYWDFTTESGPKITVTLPNGGETWYVSQYRNIRWTSQNVTGNVKIEISRNGGSTWSTIASNTANDGIYGWTVTSPASTSCRVKVSSVSDPGVNDMSDANFSILFPFITVNSPNGGETWYVGDTSKITWTSGGADKYLKIEISRNSGSSWSTIINSTLNNGLYNWVVTGPASGVCMIRISDSSLSDTSDRPFAIIESAPPCEGDFDDDGDVDGSDLAVFAADFGRTDCSNLPPCEGDFDGDNDVDGSDLAVFAADFGRTDCP